MSPVRSPGRVKAQRAPDDAASSGPEHQCSPFCPRVSCGVSGMHGGRAPSVPDGCRMFGWVTVDRRAGKFSSDSVKVSVTRAILGVEGKTYRHVLESRDGLSDGHEAPPPSRWNPQSRHRRLRGGRPIDADEVEDLDLSTAAPCNHARVSERIAVVDFRDSNQISGCVHTGCGASPDRRAGGRHGRIQAPATSLRRVTDGD